MKRFIFAVVAGVSMLASAATYARGGEYYFVVENNTDSRIEHLVVSPDGDRWGHFDIGLGIAPGKSMKVVWDESTNDLPCEHYLAAGFADGEISEPVMFDFCRDMDEPIVFD